VTFLYVPTDIRLHRLRDRHRRLFLAADDAALPQAP
jgi:hypothetical protein